MPQSYRHHDIIEHVLGFHDDNVTGDEFIAHGAVGDFSLVLHVIPQLRRLYALASSTNWNYESVHGMYRYLSQSLGYDQVLPRVARLVDGEYKALSGYSHTYLNRNGLINNVSVIFGNVLVGSHERDPDYGYIRQQCNALCSELAALLSCTKPVHESILGSADAGIAGAEFIDKPPRKDEIIDHGNGIIQKFENNNEFWYKNGQLHRDTDLPAITAYDGTRSWYQHGELHRDNGKPTVVRPNGKVEYWG